MKIFFTRWISGVLFIVLGLMISVGPQTIFKPCSELLQIYSGGIQGQVMQGQGMQQTPSDTRYVPMKCHWSAIAEIGIGGAMALLGFLFLLSGKPQLRLGLSFAQAALGLVAVLMPTKLIGTCVGKMMQCNILMLPMLLVMGCLVIAVSIVNVFLLFRNARGQR